MDRPRIVLASTSRYRRELVSQLGIDVECVAPAYDEDAALEALGDVSPADIATHHARGKAASVAALHEEAVVIGSDQVIALGQEVLHKPGTAARAEAQLARLAGRTHDSFCAVAVALGPRIEVELDVHHLRMRALNAGQIAAYVARDRPLDCAGSYRIESLGIALFERLDGADYTGVIGLPLTRLAALLARFGVDVLG